MLPTYTSEEQAVRVQIYKCFDEGMDKYQCKKHLMDVGYVHYRDADQNVSMATLKYTTLDRIKHYYRVFAENERIMGMREPHNVKTLFPRGA